jgi:multiple sugar transport system substrate-binding protein
VITGAAAGAAATMLARPAFARRQEAVSGKVTMWAYPLLTSGEQTDEEMWAELIGAFNAEYPDVEVEVEVLPWAQRNEKLTTALAAGAGPDVGYLNDDFIPQHGGDGNLLPLDDLLGGDAADFTEHAITSMSIDGTLYAVPILASAGTMLYNRKLFAEVGVDTYPTTWDEVLELGPEFKDAGYFVTAYDGSLEQTLNGTYFPLLWQAGGEVLNEDGTAAAFNDEAGLETLTFIKELYDNGFVNRDEAVTQSEPGGGSVLAGKVGVVLQGDAATAFPMIENLGEDAVEIGEPLANKVQVAYGTSAGYGVFKDAQDPDAAKAWVKYITSPEPMQQILIAGGFLAPRVSLEGMHADDPVLGKLEPLLGMMHGGVRHRASRQINSAMSPYIQAGFLGEQPLEDALAAAEKDVNRLIERS